MGDSPQIVSGNSVALFGDGRLDEIELTETTPIEDVIHSIVHGQFKLTDVDCSPWIEKLRQNLVVDFGLLSRLHPKRLERLELPLLLEDELSRRIELIQELGGLGHSKKKNRRKGMMSGQHQQQQQLGGSGGAGNRNSTAGTSSDKGALLGLSDEMRISIKESWAIITGRSTSTALPASAVSPLNQFFECVLSYIQYFPVSFFVSYPLNDTERKTHPVVGITAWSTAMS
jgi:hypothetical protein